MPERGVFGLPPGVDFPAALVAGLEDRLAGAPPEDWARVTIFVNTGRMQRRLKALFEEGPPRLLPRIRLITDLAADAGFPDLPDAERPLHLRLELAELMRRLIDANPGLAPASAANGLAESLAALIDEMAGEGVPREALEGLDVGAHAAHWQRSLVILSAAFDHFGTGAERVPSAEARRRLVVEALQRRWAERPPEDPVIVAGSTGSRGTTRALMEAVAALPRGAVILPGFDFDMPRDVWSSLSSSAEAEDHPQYRFAAFLGALGLAPEEISPWTAIQSPSPERARLVSLSLRPAPVSDRWMEEGPKLEGLDRAAAGLTLIEAPDPASEAAAIALCLRRAIDEGKSAALVTPDRLLGRRVTAALDRWGIRPDDSAGIPLNQSAPGRLLRQIAEAAGEGRLPLAGLLMLLKHPLVATGGENRRRHTLLVRRLEPWLRRKGLPYPGKDALFEWARDEEQSAWAAWVSERLADLSALPSEATIGTHMAAQLAVAEALAAGPGETGSGGLWEQAAGYSARSVAEMLLDAGETGGAMPARDFSDLLAGELAALPVRDPRLADPRVAIWGTLEARVGGADVTILGGLAEGVWPASPAPDPWLNRVMRDQVGLLLPERRIGLAAHDYQMAVCGAEVVLSRPLRDAEAETVPSRWLNRLTNLLGGLGPSGEAALEGMRGRGATLLAEAKALDLPVETVPPAERPSPRPPEDARPTELPVTSVQRLIRDPYEIYARRILGLQPMPPLAPLADAGMKGSLLHRMMEAFLKAREEWRGDPAKAAVVLERISQEMLTEAEDWPMERAVWAAQLSDDLPALASAEVARLSLGEPALQERKGRASLTGQDFTLTATPDRVDRLTDGRYALYDYKTGTVPSEKVVAAFDFQLPLTAALLERGGFDGLPAAEVATLAYLKMDGEDRNVGELDKEGRRRADVAWEGLHRLIARYARRAQGYTARRALMTTAREGDYDHLSRHGEWTIADEARPEEVGP
ncbi:double-strand break repair protein AddB [Tropicimonas sp. IMCC34011]|uniref:double-strand break repair protein AddB n=1 Tax=Tropicimonas sp. IMCC34011 TaxID=2248759 RepID=UPI000E283C47|nr:double-strand break repair protein AddB [Tropicimonas sp. IMCC34011]